MYNYIFEANTLFDFVMCGKFEAISPDWKHYRHVLTEYEYILVTDGILYLTENSTDYELHTGDYILLNKDSLISGSKASLCSFYWLHFSSTLAPQILDEVPQTLESQTSPREQKSILIPHTAHMNGLERLIILLKQLQDVELRYHDSTYNRALILAILSETFHQCSLCNLSSQKGEQLYRSITTYISFHSTQSLSVQELANHFGYNQKYLTSFFHQFAGCSIKQYMLKTKMELAKASLSKTDQSVSEIALSIGYIDVHNFSNAFKKVTGLSPSAYRQTYSLEHINYT